MYFTLKHCNIMKIVLNKVRESFKENDRRVLTEDELAFITGECAILSGSGTSSTSGSTCCDATCVCKSYPSGSSGSSGAGSGSGSGSR